MSKQYVTLPDVPFLAKHFLAGCHFSLKLKSKTFTYGVIKTRRPLLIQGGQVVWADVPDWSAPSFNASHSKLVKAKFYSGKPSNFFVSGFCIHFIAALCDLIERFFVVSRMAGADHLLHL
jgi:hypothetical protein